ncbi:MAG: DUF3015 domain-containing protein [Gammaproteobacteria bacterium]|nr:DUF3015 domain-containing protein [Gammaproteobacteria bacterium]
MKYVKKSLISALTLSALVSATPMAMAADNVGAGCGLGQQIFAGQSGFFAHSSAASTNQSAFIQQIGILAGTMGCDGDNSVVSNDQERKEFVASNMDNLTQEIAQGQGNHLFALAEIMGIAQADRGHFYEMAQGQYGTLFESTDTTSSELLASLDNAMMSDAAMAKYIK